MRTSVQKSRPGQDRVSDKTSLLLKFNYISSALSFALGLSMLFGLGIKGVITFTFFIYALLNLTNIVLFKTHRNLTAMALYTSVLSLLSTLAITLYSGGIASPFVFILAIIVLAGYVSTRLFGRIYQYIVLVIVLLVFAIDKADPSFIVNEIPPNSQDVFDLACVLFAVYLLGGVFGKELLTAHHNLYRSKAEIENRIEEKETLIKEVHHRVKNNLQTISSLLNLQSKNSLSPEIRTLVKSSQNRIKAMSIIHEMLYAHDNLSRIRFEPYVRDLADYLVQSMADRYKTVEVEIDVPEVKFSLDTAIPLGLLINEVVTNSLKHAFKDKDSGKIGIKLIAEPGSRQYHLELSDNGVGFLENANLKNSKSLGLKLIRNLARQLHGTVERKTTSTGTVYQVHFKVDEPSEPTVSDRHEPLGKAHPTEI